MGAHDSVFTACCLEYIRSKCAAFHAPCLGMTQLELACSEFSWAKGLNNTHFIQVWPLLPSCLCWHPTRMFKTSEAGLAISVHGQGKKGSTGQPAKLPVTLLLQCGLHSMAPLNLHCFSCLDLPEGMASSPHP